MYGFTDLVYKDVKNKMNFFLANIENKLN